MSGVGAGAWRRGGEGARSTLPGATMEAKMKMKRRLERGTRESDEDSAEEAEMSRLTDLKVRGECVPGTARRRR